MGNKVLVIVGPTASGKSALAVELARRFNGEIISADSRQVYRGLDIGTGKVTPREMQGVPHHLLDVAPPTRKFSAHDFLTRARTAIEEIHARGKLPIICGGTGFYIDALLGRIDLSDVTPDSALRTRLKKKSAAQLYAMLQKADSARAESMSSPSERNNTVRLIRALEIAAHTRKSKHPSAKVRPVHDVLWIGIERDQGELEKRIQARLAVRIKLGMIAEAKRLHAHGLSYKRMEELGLEYRSLARLLQKKITREEFEEELFRDIRRYAKKQMMYWNRNADITWYTPKSKEMSRAIARWLSREQL